MKTSTAGKFVAYGKDEKEGYYTVVRDNKSPRIIVTKQSTQLDALWEAFNRLEDYLNVHGGAPEWVKSAMNDILRSIDKAIG